jgi:hypothetical protein
MPDSNKTLDTGNITTTVNLTSVLGIKATCKATVASAGGPSQDNSSVQIYEIEADYYITVDRGYSGII